VSFGGEVVSAAQEFHVIARSVLAHFVHQLDKAQIKDASRGGRRNGFALRNH
jgi:hypothetical protein